MKSAYTQCICLWLSVIKLLAEKSFCEVHMVFLQYNYRTRDPDHARGSYNYNKIINALCVYDILWETAIQLIIKCY